MKKVVILVCIAGFLSACGGNEKKAADNEAVGVVPPASASKNSEAFNQSFQNLLGTYYALKDALVDYDTAKANAASRQLAVYADNLNLNDIKTDSGGGKIKTAENYARTISGSALGFAGDMELSKKKKKFQMISDAMYDLARTVKYDREKIYHQHCPMAINETEEAYWLSNNSAISNPYLGRKHPKYKDAMVECGDVTDSLDFSR